MRALAFELSNVPDLTLARYSSLEGSGIEGVLEKHADFLRQFSGKPHTSLHLLYAYSPTSPDGSRLKVHLVVCGTGDDPDASLDNVPKLIESSPLSPYFKLLPYVADEQGRPVVTRVEDIASRLAEDLLYGAGKFPTCSALLKAVRFVNPTPPHPDAPKGYYVQPEFKVSEKARLFSMMKLMESLAEPLVYRIDLYPTNRGETLRASLPLNRIREKRDSQGLGRNYELEGIEKTYERLLEKLDGSPLFNVNVFAYALSDESGRAVLEAAASEAIEKGASNVVHFHGAFEPLSFLGDQPWKDELTSIDGRHVATFFRNRRERPGYFIFPQDARNFAHCDIATLFTLEDAAALFRLPTLYDGEYVQCRKETAPPAVDASGALFLGVDTNGQDVNFATRLLPKHAFISGMPGSGKTNTMHHFVTSLVGQGVPVLVLEPAKREYRAVLNCPGMEHVVVFSPGGDTPFPLRINPFELPYGVSVGHHINRLCQVFEGSFPLEGALPFILDRSIEAVYRKHGWTPKMRRRKGGTKDFPTLSELYEQMEIELEKESYEGEVKGNLTSALRMRIGGLLRRELGDLFDVPWSTVEPNEWLKIPAIVELEALGTSQSNFLTLLLCVLIRESLMADPVYSAGPVRHVIFIEEAHNLIGPEAEATTGEHADPKQTATAFISDMLREVRAYKEGIIIADQLPTAIAPEVLKNTGLKIALRITSAEDRELLGAMMNANGVQLERMGVADPGRALVSYEGLMRPFEAQMAEWLGHPGAPDYVADRRERRRLSESLENKPLLDVLKRRGTPWHTKNVLRAFSIDVLCVEKRLGELKRQLGRVFSTIEELRDASAEADIYGDFAILRTAAHAALGTEEPPEETVRLRLAKENVRIALGDARMGSLAEAIVAYQGAYDVLESKREGWPQFGPEFDVFVEQPSIAILRNEKPLTAEWQLAYRFLDLYAKIQHRLVDLQEADALRNNQKDSAYYSKVREKLSLLDEALASGEKSLAALGIFGE